MLQKELEQFLLAFIYKNNKTIIFAQRGVEHFLELAIVIIWKIYVNALLEWFDPYDYVIVCISYLFKYTEKKNIIT